MSRGHGRAEMHVLGRLAATGRRMTVRELVAGYASPSCQPTRAEYEAVRRAAARLADEDRIAFYSPQRCRPGRGGWYALRSYRDDTFTTLRERGAA